MNVMTNNLHFPVVQILVLLFEFIGAVPQVETPLGTILGSQKITENGNRFASFTGIPYIEPPVDELRFKPPVPAKPFKEVFNAISDNAVCPQNLLGNYMGTEDCIILNVYTPWDGSASFLRNVMVFVHGGAFLGLSSQSDFQGLPDYLMDKNIVLVTVNYRLGVLGFLSTGDEEAPGNYGLLDQVEALKWVKNNIASFGGNPNQVTIFGQSAGGASVHFHMLSPLSKGLFHRAISQSGTAISSWSITEISRKNTKVLAEKLHCPTASSFEILECLRGKEAKELVTTAVVEANKTAALVPFVWAPRIDQEADSPFLPENPFNIMKSGNYIKVPLLIGHTKHEDEGFVGAQTESYNNQANDMTVGWDNYCKLNMAFREHMVPEKTGTELCNEVRDHYIDPTKSFEENKMEYIKMFEDIVLNSGISKSIELMANQSPVYRYTFDYDNGETSFFSLGLFGSGYKYIKGIVGHGDDLLYLFKYPQTNWTIKSPEYEMVKMMTTIWTEFAQTGQPIIPKLDMPWPRATSKQSEYVSIKIVPTIERNYRPEDMDFVNCIYNQTIYEMNTNNDASSSPFKAC